MSSRPSLAWMASMDMAGTGQRHMFTDEAPKYTSNERALATVPGASIGERARAYQDQTSLGARSVVQHRCRSLRQIGAHPIWRNARRIATSLS